MIYITCLPLSLLFITLSFIQCEEQSKPVDSPWKVTHIVFLDVAIRTKAAGRIVIGIFGDSTPKAAANFLSLCTGGHGVKFKGGSFTAVLKKFYIQASLENPKQSTMGDEKYHETSALRVYQVGAVVMNVEENKIGNKFSIITGRPESVTGQPIVGHVIEGMEVVQKIADVETDRGKPQKSIMITNSGILQFQDCVIGLARFYLQREPQLAVDEYEKCLEISAQIPIPSRDFEAFLGLGQAYEKVDGPSDLIIELYTKAHDIYHRVEAAIRLSKFYQKTKEPQLATEWAVEACSMPKPVQFLETLSEEEREEQEDLYNVQRWKYLRDLARIYDSPSLLSWAELSQLQV